MLSTSQTTLRQIENNFYEYCVAYFDDLPDEKNIIIKIPLPNINYSYIQTYIITLITILAKFFSGKSENSVAIETTPENHLNKQINNENHISNSLGNTNKSPDFVIIQLRIPRKLINCIRRLIFVDRFT